MSLAAKIDEQKDERIKTWKTAFFALFVICLFISVNNYQLRKEILIHVAPDLSVAQTIKSGRVSEAYVYNFAYTIFSGISRWKTDGQVEYKRNVEIYSAYLGYKLRKQLTDDYASRLTEGRGRINELKGRTREISLVSIDNTASMVRQLSSTTFRVYLDVYDEERVNGSIVKKGAYRYTFDVAVDTSNLLTNDTGLKLLGLAGEPEPILQ